MPRELAVDLFAGGVGTGLAAPKRPPISGSDHAHVPDGAEYRWCRCGNHDPWLFRADGSLMLILCEEADDAFAERVERLLNSTGSIIPTAPSDELLVDALVARATAGRATRRLDRTPSWRPGDTIWYAPTLGGARYPGVVDSEPRLLGGVTWVVRLRDMCPEYGLATGRPGRTTVAAAECELHLTARLDDSSTVGASDSVGELGRTEEGNQLSARVDRCHPIAGAAIPSCNPTGASEQKPKRQLCRSSNSHAAGMVPEETSGRGSPIPLETNRRVTLDRFDLSAAYARVLARGRAVA